MRGDEMGGGVRMRGEEIREGVRMRGEEMRGGERRGEGGGERSVGGWGVCGLVVECGLMPLPLPLLPLSVHDHRTVISKHTSRTSLATTAPATQGSRMRTAMCKSPAA